MNVNSILKKLMSLKDKHIKEPLTINEISLICKKALSILKEENSLLKLEAPMIVCGDIHGQYYDLLRIFNHIGHPPSFKYLMLGDYVDRGKWGIEVLCFLLCYKINYPDRIFLTRGNHECEFVNENYGFKDECIKRYNINIWNKFVSIFDCLPIAAIINNSIFCVHAGISPKLKTISQIDKIKRPIKIPQKGLLCDLMWSDPTIDTTDFMESDRGVSYLFGSNVLNKFMKDNKIDLVIRAHEMVDDGFKFFANKKLITVFSAPNYCNDEDNSACVIKITSELECSFIIFKPVNSLQDIKQKDKVRKKLKSQPHTKKEKNTEIPISTNTNNTTKGPRRKTKSLPSRLK